MGIFVPGIVVSANRITVNIVRVNDWIGDISFISSNASYRIIDFWTSLLFSVSVSPRLCLKTKRTFAKNGLELIR